MLHSPPLSVDALGSSPHICGRCLGPPLGTPIHGHVEQGLMLRIPSVTPHVQNRLYGPALHVERTCIRVAPRLHFRPRFMLIRRCYVWKNKAYKLALTLLDFQGGTKSTNNNSTCANFTTTTGY